MESKILEENKVGQRLKQYFSHMERVYGEEVAIETALTGFSIRHSIAKFSNGFDDFYDADINVEILKACVLSDRQQDTTIKYANNLIQSGKIEQLLIDMDANKLLKRGIVENYLRNIYSTTEKMYKKAQVNPSYRTIDEELEKLNDYQQSQMSLFTPSITVKTVKAKVLEETNIPVAVRR